MTIPYKAYVFLTLAMIIVGSSAVAGSQMVAELPVHLASLLRFGLAALLLVPILYWREGGFPRLRLKTHVLLCLQSVCGSFLFTLLFLEGLRLTSPASAGIITSTTPACMAVIAWIFFHERPRRRVLAGVACSMGGILLVHLAGASGHMDGTDTGSSLYGNLLVMGAVFFESMFLLLRKQIREPLSPLAASTLGQSLRRYALSAPGIGGSLFFFLGGAAAGNMACCRILRRCRDRAGLFVLVCRHRTRSSRGCRRLHRSHARQRCGIVPCGIRGSNQSVAAGRMSGGCFGDLFHIRDRGWTHDL